MQYAPEAETLMRVAGERSVHVPVARTQMIDQVRCSRLRRASIALLAPTPPTPPSLPPARRRTCSWSWCCTRWSSTCGASPRRRARCSRPRIGAARACCGCRSWLCCCRSWRPASPRGRYRRCSTTTRRCTRCAPQARARTFVRHTPAALTVVAARRRGGQRGGRPGGQRARACPVWRATGADPRAGARFQQRRAHSGARGLGGDAGRDRGRVCGHAAGAPHRAAAAAPRAEPAGRGAQPTRGRGCGGRRCEQRLGRRGAGRGERRGAHGGELPSRPCRPARAVGCGFRAGTPSAACARVAEWSAWRGSIVRTA